MIPFLTPIFCPNVKLSILTWRVIILSSNSKRQLISWKRLMSNKLWWTWSCLVLLGVYPFWWWHVVSNSMLLIFFMFPPQSISLEKQAKTSNCNFLEIVYHSWHVASMKRGVDFFEVTADDLAWAITQMSRYYDFSNYGKSQNRDHNRVELLWHSMHHHHNHVAIARIVDKHALELHYQVPHSKRDMKFGFVKSFFLWIGCC